MLARAETGTIVGIDAIRVIVEIEAGKGLPKWTLIGLACGAARESVDRVKTAIASCDLHLPKARRVVNLLPAEVRKNASALDLALAVSALSASNLIPHDSLTGRRFFGELTLGGTLEPVRGAVAVADLARRAGDPEIIVPLANAAEAAIIPGIRVVGARDLREVVAHLRGDACLQREEPKPPSEEAPEDPCLSDVAGQEWARRALEIAAAGNHNLLMVGPPGSGKTMLARRLPGIMPPLHYEERIEVTRIRSACGHHQAGLVSSRPFRAPHHTASEMAICGGGRVPRPGEVTLAHRGVLFLDELPEFTRRALEGLREPLEEGHIHVARAAQSLRFPADILLVAAMNPCPCGNFREDGDASRTGECLCAYDQVQRYRSRVSGPLLDRIDIQVRVERVPFVVHGERGENSTVVRSRVEAARTVQMARQGHANARLGERQLGQLVVLSPRGRTALEQVVERGELSARGVQRVLKVARTIADLAGHAEVADTHVAEALALRCADLQGKMLGAAA